MSDVVQFSNADKVIRARRRAARNLIPPPDILPTKWASRNVRIPVGNAIPGPISFANAPFQRGMIDVIKEPGVLRVTYKTGAQLGKTTCQQVITGYFIAHEPRSQIFVQPSQGDMQTFVETKLRPMLDANESIKSKMAAQRGRDGVNNSRMISYIGGWLMMAWAGSPKTLRGRSAPVTQADEIDGYDVTSEGDPVQLLVQRSATFGDQRLLIESSTPTIKGASRIDTAYDAGDQRRFYVPCPHCGHAQYLRWEQVAWTGRDTPDGEQDPDTAVYHCEGAGCGVGWTDGERIAAIRTAEEKGHGWKASKPFKGHASFHAPEMLSTFRRLRDIVQSYLDKMAVGDLQSFVNVSLGEVFEEIGEKADPESLRARRESYAAAVPMEGVYLTAGIDMQMDRLEVEVVAWGIGEQSWSVAYFVLWGDPLGDEVWQDLDDVLDDTYQHESGAHLRISAACLDTGGTDGCTQAAYEYAKKRGTGRKLFAVKGIGGWDRAIVEKSQGKTTGKKGRKVNLFLVGTDNAKLVVMRRLALQKPGPGYCHFPSDRGDEWFDQLTAEKLTTRYLKGFPIREWKKPDRARNEGLDCRVYATAALKISPPNFKRIAERLKPGRSVLEPEKELPDEEVVEEPTVQEVVRDAVRKIVSKEKAENPHKEAESLKPQNRPIKRSRAVKAAGRGFVNRY